MAVVRPELMVSEVDWLVELLQARRLTKAQKRTLNELRRAQQRGQALEAYERATVKRLRADMTARHNGAAA